MAVVEEERASAQTGSHPALKNHAGPFQPCESGFERECSHELALEICFVHIETPADVSRAAGQASAGNDVARRQDLDCLPTCLRKPKAASIGRESLVLFGRGCYASRRV